MSDRAFVANAQARWKALLEAVDAMDGEAAAISLALWATLNVDKLLEIASRKVRP